MDSQYLPIYQSECSSCTSGPVVGLVSPSRAICSTGLCGPCFFGDKTMVDPEEWNKAREATE